MKKGISQETLKLIACVSMLIDHIGATLVLRFLQNGAILGYNMGLLNVYYVMRIIGRIAFPIYCFLLVEGAHHTRDPKKYALRLGLGVLLSEIPFDLAFNGGAFDWSSNSVMITLLLGFLMIEATMRVKGFWKLVIIVPFYMAAEWMKTDYAGLGILIIAVLALTRGVKQEKLLRLIGLGAVLIPGAKFYIFDMWINLESFAMLALIPIFCYSGKKLTRSKKPQGAFYLFYPVHLTVLWALEGLFFG